MKNWLRILLILVAGYVVFLIATLPASWVMERATLANPALKAYGVQGSAWKGTASALVIQGWQIDSVAWELSPWRLLTGEAQIAWHSTGTTLHGDGVLLAGLWGDAIGMKDLDARVPVEVVARQMRLPGITPQGVLLIDLDELRIGGQQIQAVSGTLTWQHAALSDTLRLGDIRAELGMQEQEVRARIKDQGGPVAIDGLLRLKPDGNYRFEAALGARDSNDAGLNATLRLLGQPGSDGRIRVEHTGHAPLGQWLATR